MFSTKGQDYHVDFLEPMRGQVIATMNEEFSCTFTKEEVEIALKQMHPFKAPEPYGMPPLYYQKRSIVGEYVTTTVLNVLNTS